MLTNADITIYNHKLNKDTRLDEWHRTVIKGVHFYVDHKSRVSDNGLVSADVYKIRIPDDVECAGKYVTPEQYQELRYIAGHWTIQEDDYIVLGECNIEINRPAELKEAHKRHCKVTSWSDNRRGSTPHWRIGGE